MQTGSGTSAGRSAFPVLDVSDEFGSNPPRIQGDVRRNSAISGVLRPCNALMRAKHHAWPRLLASVDFADALPAPTLGRYRGLSSALWISLIRPSIWSATGGLKPICSPPSALHFLCRNPERRGKRSSKYLSQSQTTTIGNEISQGRCRSFIPQWRSIHLDLSRTSAGGRPLRDPRDQPSIQLGELRRHRHQREPAQEVPAGRVQDSVSRDG